VPGAHTEVALAAITSSLSICLPLVEVEVRSHTDVPCVKDVTLCTQEESDVIFTEMNRLARVQGTRALARAVDPLVAAGPVSLCALECDALKSSWAGADTRPP
jgi:hypothetical protein